MLHFHLFYILIQGLIKKDFEITKKKMTTLQSGNKHMHGFVKKEKTGLGITCVERECIFSEILFSNGKV